ncbi:MAG: hypothetical protein IJ273_02655, partial [Alphaproteobacteria bacterium]|nr:hypothetical protein [Alphaproteobacteria bacterium]
MKHTSRFMLFASLIAASGMLCCSEDNDTTEDNDISTCTDGTWKCDGNTLSKCISGKWETIHICDENTLCNIATGTCAPNDTSNCTDGTWKCDGNTLSKCASGKWEFSQTCKENTQCNSKKGTCEANDVSECTDGSWKCDGNTLSKCASGKWEWVQDCALYDQCNAETGTCDVTLIPDCAEDEHIWNNTCEKDSIENCLEHGNQCKNVANAKSICDREYGGCWFECNEGFGQYVTGIGECSLGGEKYTCNIPGDECVPAFQSKWKLGSRHHYSGTDGKSDASVTIPIDLPKDKSESITIDWGDGQFDLITSETEISKDHSGSNLYWSATYVDKVNDKTFIYHEYPNFDGNLEYVTVKIVGTSNWSCPDKSLERCGM